MMVLPSKHEMELFDKITPWLKFNAKTEEFYLIDGAPDDVKKAWIEWKKIIAEQSKNPFYQECG